jgi:hypothetical protein
MNRLREFCRARDNAGGAGIWKWDHYFEIYDRHFARFRGCAVHVLEIGVYSGGSLDMWLDYFGPQAVIYGVDVAAECETYRRPGVEIFIGDQSRVEFWENFRAAVPRLDIVIDDGSHKPRHQALTMGQLLPYLAPGGVYLCEDIHGYPQNEFFDAAIVPLAAALNNHQGHQKDKGSKERRLVKQTTELQSAIDSIHLYPYAAVIEKRAAPIAEFVAPKLGSQWQPFLE